jgi:hypothetical protein
MPPDGYKKCFASSPLSYRVSDVTFGHFTSESPRAIKAATKATSPFYLLHAISLISLATIFSTYRPMMLDIDAASSSRPFHLTAA